MPLPANSLIQSAWHVTANVHILCWVSKYEYNADDSRSIEYRCLRLPAPLEHFTFCGCQWRWMCALH